MVKDSVLPLQGAQVRFLVRELKSRKMRSTAKKKKKYLNIYVCVCVYVYKAILKAHFNYLICRETQDWGDRVARNSLYLEMETSQETNEQTWKERTGNLAKDMAGTETCLLS